MIADESLLRLDVEICMVTCYECCTSGNTATHTTIDV